MLRLAHIPNAICILRILLIGPIIYGLLAGDFALSLLLVIVAGLSDGLDGFLAKRFNWRTRLGGLLDPLADKLLLVSVFLSLAWLGVAPLWLAVVVIARDLVIVSGALAYEHLISEVQPEPTKISKLNTGLQLLYILFALSRLAMDWPAETSLLVIGAAVLVISVVSGLDYVLTWSARARARHSS